MYSLKVFIATHFKKNTQKWSPNEVSFDVLQRKKLTTVDSRTRAPWELSEESKSKKFRVANPERWIRMAMVAIAILVFLALALMGAAAWMQNQTGALGKLGNQITSVKNSSDDLEEMISVANCLMNSDANEIERTVDTTKISEAESVAKKKAKEMETEKSDVTFTLNEIGTPTDREAGNNAITLVNKQLLLIDRFYSIENYCKVYITVITNVNKGLAKLIEADSVDREASSQLTDGNSEQAKKSIESAARAKSLALEAKSCFEQAKSANNKSSDSFMDSSKFDEYVTYCQLMADAQDAAVDSANAYIARNKEQLVTKNKEYNDAKEKATEISDGWEKQLADIVDDAFFERRSSDVDGFNQDLKERDVLYKSISTYLEG